MDTTLPGTPDKIYNLLFASEVLQDFMANELNATEFQISDWHPEQSNSLLKRDIRYTQRTDRTNGKARLKQEIPLADFEGYASVLTTRYNFMDFCVAKTRTCIMWAGATVSRLVVTTTLVPNQSPFLSFWRMGISLDEEERYYVNLEQEMRSYIAAHRTEFIPDNLAAGRLQDATPVMCLTNEGVMRLIPASHTPRYTASALHKYLIQHGCADLNSLVDPLGFSSSAIAEGGFGDVWTGRLRNNQMKVAVKVLRCTSLAGEVAEKELKRLTREIYNWSKLEHENVNKLMGVVMFRERLGMVSEWMEHGNLRQYAHRNSGVDRRKMCIQITKGVAYIHSVNMVHGDLKACNILVSSAGFLKITDFDYSIFPECSLALSATSRTGGGTLRWMAPELVLATDENPPQRNMGTDIYALGMTFLEIITNAHPYAECRYDQQILIKLLHKQHPKRSEEYFPNTEWGNQIWSLLVQCWDFNSTSRPVASDILRLLLDFKK
ncbi:kinase-like domain-containing protein [Rhizoctonia solani]|nr:kinase-like domain-containing protein [Rhizoctonia solani]